MKLTLFSSTGFDTNEINLVCTGQTNTSFRVSLNRPMRSQHPSGSANDRLFKNETSPIFSGEEEEEMNCYMLPTALLAEQRAVGKMEL